MGSAPPVLVPVLVTCLETQRKSRSLGVPSDCLSILSCYLITPPQIPSFLAT